ncbi:hypothetical protein PV327_001754 [Microctonus hyperodae]|uniref:Peptidase M1 membrane alanine aminopeptidase domain-containing protein n=1 Tax=Microctonus hyperodae TaxID=165561 RepID=A0AA39FEI3_MICHY|nr:hypothetical protein PV327_001754 [Microctonus hyperodae]
MTSISNMPRMNSPEPVREMASYVWDHYQRSVPMSTYLVAFIVSDFDVLPMAENNFRVWARHEGIKQSQYALDIGPKILQYYEDYFQIKFPLPKIDMVALPDFAAGAMENWGLITYSQFVGEVIPENYKLLLNFSGNEDCSVKKCIYGGKVVITMLVTGKGIFTLQSDPETNIDQAKTELYRIYPNNTRVPAKIMNYVYTTGDISAIIEVQVEQIFHMMSESQYELILYFTREFDDQSGIYGADAESRNDTNNTSNSSL